MARLAKPHTMPPGNQHLPRPLDKTKTYIVVEENVDNNPQYIKIKNQGKEDIFSAHYFNLYGK